MPNPAGIFLPPTVSLADGTCAIVDLGVLSSGDVYGERHRG